MTKLEKILVATAAVILVVVLIGVYDSWKHCKEANGTLVRGLFEYVCIK